VSNSAATPGVQSGQGQLQRADGSKTLDRGVRVGLVVYGVMHLLIALIAIQLVLGEAGGEKASGSGAFDQLAESGAGRSVLWVMVLGFLMLVLWQGIDAAVGHQDEEGGKRVAKRGVSAARAVLYAVLGVSAATTAISAGGGSGGSGGGASPDSLTARLMSAPGGQVLVVLVGLGIVAVGGVLVYRGLAEKFTKHLDAGASRGDRRGPIILLGKVGYAAKGVALGAVGVLVVIAGVRHNAQRSGGLDQALRELLQQPFGGWLVALVAVGLAAFGLYCFAWARHLKR
jgi:Domain of Unknown Function (DUF1206)